MKNNIRYVIFFTLIVVAISCKKKTPKDIGLPLLPGEDLLNAEYVDTLTLISHTDKDDSLLSVRLVHNLLGTISDPVFGISQASVYTQLALSQVNPAFGVNPVLDSAVLSIVYKNPQYYGTLYSQKFNVNELTQAITKDSTYYSNRTFQYNTTPLASTYLVPNPKDSIKIDTVKYPAHLRLQLDKTFFQPFLSSAAAIASYGSNTSFQTFFKGLYISTSAGVPPGEGAILNMDFTHSYSRLTLFYHNSTQDSLSYYFIITNTDCARISHFEHDYSLTPDIQNQLSTSPTIQEDKVYVQPMAGVRTKITMPYLQNLYNNGKIAINKAELILPVEPLSADSPFVAHPKLVATIADSALGPLFLPDIYEGATYFGGEYDTKNKLYKFNIARYIQQILNGTKKNQGMYIITSTSQITANRVQLIGGNKALSNPMRLKITYTPLE